MASKFYHDEIRTTENTVKSSRSTENNGVMIKKQNYGFGKTHNKEFIQKLNLQNWPKSDMIVDKLMNFKEKQAILEEKKSLTNIEALQRLKSQMT